MQRDFRLTSVQLATRDDVNDCEKYVVSLMSAFNPIMVLLKFLELNVIVCCTFDDI